MSGKMSVGVRSSTTGVSSTITSAITIKVYGLESANRTIHIERDDDLFGRSRSHDSANLGF